MTAFAVDMNAEALAAQSAAFHHQAYHAQQAVMREGGLEHVDAVYANGEGMIGGDYSMHSNGFYPPPQAPRLSAAAARASSMTAMYYNPTLHPQHSFSSHAGDMDPWMPPYHANDFGHSMAPPAYQHQQVEHQLMSQNVMSKVHQTGFNAASAYGQEHHQPGHYQPRHSYPDDRHGRTWSNAGPPPAAPAWAWQEGPYGHAQGVPHHVNMEVTPTSYAAHHGHSYFNYPKQQTGNALPYPTNSQALPQPPPPRAVDGGWERGEMWNNRGAGWAPPSYPPPEGFQGNWRDGSQCNPARWNGTAKPGDDACRPQQWVGQPPYQSTLHQTTVEPAPALAPALSHYPKHGYTGPQGPSQDSAASMTTACQRGAEKPAPQVASEKQSNGGPAPPSPETLDKSSVPISSVGAEIVWSACAALLEPELIRLCSRSEAGDCPPSTPNHTPFSDRDWLSSPQEQSLGPRSGRGKSQLPQRLAFGAGDGAATSSEESSASSSEPGTPPSSIPSYLYDEMHRMGSGRREKGQSLGTVHGLGLSPSDTTFGAAAQLTSPRKYVFNQLASVPPSDRMASQDRAGETVLGALNLVSPAWKWSMNDDKLESLSSSLREGAKVQAASTHKVTPSTFNSMRRSSSSHRANGLRGDETSSSLHGTAALGSEPSPAFRRFAHQVLAQTLVSPTAFMLAMMYTLRVPHLAVQINDKGIAQLDPEATEIFANPPSAAPFKLFTLGLMIANKHLDDNTFLNKTWNEVTGISLVELNRMERWFLEKCSYEVTVPEEPWVAFLERWAARTENKLAEGNGDAKRYRVATKHRSAPIGSRATASSAKRLSSSNEEVLKRLLLSIEEALVVIGRIAPFELGGESSASAKRPQRAIASPDVDSPRPSTYLHHLHHHCHSAPALHDADDWEMDVFGEEDGPCRPQGASVRTTMMKHQHRKGSVDFAFHRSISENAAPLSCPQQGRGKDENEPDAPLAPSVLLDLLNRGQHYAHAAQ